MSSINKSQTYRIFNHNINSLEFNFDYNKQETKDLHQLLNRKPNIDLNDLRRISLWKLDRVMSVTDETLKKLHLLQSKQNLEVTDDAVHDAIDALVSSDGIGYPMASAILKFLRPDVFPIIDVRAYRALTGTKLFYSTYTYRRYCDYVAELLVIAKATNRPLQDIDEQLYCFDKKYNGKI